MWKCISNCWIWPLLSHCLHEHGNINLFFKEEYIYDKSSGIPIWWWHVTNVQSINQTQWTRKIVLDISHWAAVYRANWAFFSKIKSCV